MSSGTPAPRTTSSPRPVVEENQIYQTDWAEIRSPRAKDRFERMKRVGLARGHTEASFQDLYLKCVAHAADTMYDGSNTFLPITEIPTAPTLNSQHFYVCVDLHTRACLQPDAPWPQNLPLDRDRHARPWSPEYLHNFMYWSLWLGDGHTRNSQGGLEPYPVKSLQERQAHHARYAGHLNAQRHEPSGSLARGDRLPNEIPLDNGHSQVNGETQNGGRPQGDGEIQNGEQSHVNGETKNGGSPQVNGRAQNGEQLQVNGGTQNNAEHSQVNENSQDQDYLEDIF